MLHAPTIVHVYNNNNFFSLLTYLAILLGLLLCLQLLKLKTNQTENKTALLPSILNAVAEKVQTPLLFLILIYIGDIALNLWGHLVAGTVFQLLNYVLKIGEYALYFWLVLDSYHTVNARLLEWFVQTRRNALYVIMSTLAQSLYAAIGLLMVLFFIPLLGITGLQEALLEKIAKLLLIGTIGWIFLKLVDGIQKLIIHYINVANNSGIKIRAINTQVILMKKILQILIIIVTIAAGLMCFDSVRNLGAGLLTTAGVLGAIGAFASQQSLSRLFTGLQLAFSQPIRIGDRVIVDNENGQIEEIALSYVVVKLWDLRRLILPADYFFSKGLQNLTRNSTELLGTIFIYADYTLPIDDIREKFFEFLNSSELWNKNVATFQLTDVKENTIELRGLVSANDADTLWNLRCDIREKLMKYIVSTYPDSLPMNRNVFKKVNDEKI